MKGIGDYFWLISTDFAGITYTLVPVVSQSVKEVLQSLVDDNLVQMDKIGSSNCRYCSCLLSPPSSPWSYIQRRMPAAGLGSLLELPFSEGCDRKFLCHCHWGYSIITLNP
jgi:hypothetical protein